MFFARVTKVVGTPVQSLRFCDKRFWDITMADEKDKRSEGSESDTPTVNVEEIVVGCNELGEIVSKKLNLFILNTHDITQKKTFTVISRGSTIWCGMESITPYGNIYLNWIFSQIESQTF